MIQISYLCNPWIDENFLAYEKAGQILSEKLVPGSPLTVSGTDSPGWMILNIKKIFQLLEGCFLYYLLIMKRS